jgi:hypothetical protein
MCRTFSHIWNFFDTDVVFMTLVASTTCFSLSTFEIVMTWSTQVTFQMTMWRTFWHIRIYTNGMRTMFAFTTYVSSFLIAIMIVCTPRSMKSMVTGEMTMCWTTADRFDADVVRVTLCAFTALLSMWTLVVVFTWFGTVTLLMLMLWTAWLGFVYCFSANRPAVLSVTADCVVVTLSATRALDCLVAGQGVLQGRAKFVVWNTFFMTAGEPLAAWFTMCAGCEFFVVVFDSADGYRTSIWHMGWHMRWHMGWHMGWLVGWLVGWHIDWHMGLSRMSQITAIDDL